jgi:tellurite resistance protein
VTEPPSEPRLKYFPVSFFAMVMGLTGLAIAWHQAEIVYVMPLRLSEALLVLAALSFAALLALYLNKLWHHREAVAQELAHPIQLNFFPTVSISLLLLAIAALPYSLGVAGVLWVVGTNLHLLLTLYIMGVWVHHQQFEIHHINPAWFIPVVGNVLVPIAGVPLGFTEVSWFFFSFGILFWLVLLAIIFYRVFFHHPLPEKLMPTFFILIAPPAVGFLAYLALTGTLDAFGRMLYYSALFLTLLLVTQIGRFVRIEFYLSWWAYSFPLAAITIATLAMYQHTGLAVFVAVGWVLLTFVTLIVVYLLYRTARAIGSRKICIPAV